MPTVVEREIHHEHDAVDSSMGGILVALAAVIVVAALAFFLYQNNYLGTNNDTAAPANNIDITVEGTLPPADTGPGATPANE